jgi:hypothetical protein
MLTAPSGNLGFTDGHYLEKVFSVEIKDFFLFIFLHEPYRPYPHSAKVTGRCAV